MRFSPAGRRNEDLDMHYHRRQGWEIPTSETTPEAIFLNRRALLAGAGALAAGAALPRRALARGGRSHRLALSGQAQRGLHARSRSDAGKDQPQLQQFLRVQHQQASLRRSAEDASLDGDDRRPGRKADQTIGIDDLVKSIGLEERLYRHRCVEAWSMAIPWTGFPLNALVAMARPLRRRNMCASRASSTRRSRPASATSRPGPMSRV